MSTKFYINSLGLVNLSTGSTRVFNVFEEWADKTDEKVTLFKGPFNGKKLLVLAKDAAEVVEILNGQSHASEGLYTKLAEFPFTKAGFQEVAQYLGKNSVRFAGLD